MNTEKEEPGREFGVVLPEPFPRNGANIGYEAAAVPEEIGKGCWRMLYLYVAVDGLC
ncbi:MAG: hypothetical protein ACE5G7_05975 [Candidatus Hydrothermarchaeaceae archaeon]